MYYFFIWRIVDTVIAYISSILIPYLGFFPYKEIFMDYKLSSFISSFANFDGAQYLIIIREGYNNLTQAYFPLYPLLVRFISPIFVSNHLLAGLLLSNLCFLIGLFFFWKYLIILTGRDSLRRNDNKASNVNNSTILFLLLFPTSFFFGALYTEGLFFLLTALVLWGLKNKKYWLVVISGLLAALTRFIGVFLIIPIGFHLISESQKSKVKSQNYKLKVKNINNAHISQVSNFKFQILNLLPLLTPILGLLTYTTYLWKTTGDPLFFFNTQPVFGANRSTHLIFLPQVYYRYFKIFLTATPDFQYLISMFEFIIFNFCLTILVISLVDSWRKFKGKDFRLWLSISNGLLLFSFINLLLPTLTGTFSSIPRYVLMSLSVFIYLGNIKKSWVKIIIGCFFGILHILCLGFFIQGYFVG